MKAANKQFLDENRHHWLTLRDAQYLRHLNGNEREGMQRVMAEEFRPGYTADLWCPHCVAEMVRLLYKHYDEWLVNNTPAAPPPEPEPEPEPEIIPEPPAEPIIVHTGFPSNKKKGK